MTRANDGGCRAVRSPRGLRGSGILFRGLMLLALSESALAANPNDASGCAACGGCGLFGGILLLIPLGVLALNIALLVWVARDAKARGMDNAVLWMVLVMLTSVIGLLIYILSRPQGILVQCPSCKNQRLQVSAKCPHCGNA